MAIASLIVSIVGTLACCFTIVVPAVGIVLGFVARKQISASNGTQKGDGMALAGIIIGAIGVVIGVIYWIAFLSSGNWDLSDSSTY